MMQLLQSHAMPESSWTRDTGQVYSGDSSDMCNAYMQNGERGFHYAWDSAAQAPSIRLRRNLGDSDAATGHVFHQRAWHW